MKYRKIDPETKVAAVLEGLRGPEATGGAPVTTGPPRKSFSKTPGRRSPGGEP